MEDPWALLRRLKLGREEFCQRLLTMLVLEGDYPRWNTRSKPSPRGLRFLRALDELSFGAPSVDDDAWFIDEMELPSRDADEAGCAPDYGVLSETRLWLIELKTEAASHRTDQVPSYFAYARHHHPDLAVDLTYLSPPYRGSVPEAPDGSRFSHLTWEQALPLVRDIWGRVDGPVGRIVEALTEAIEGSDRRWQGWRTDRTEDPVSTGVQLAGRTASDGSQRAIDHPFASIEELESVRIELRDLLAAEGSPVRPWTWRAETSGGSALTATGETCGYELRLSRYA